MFIQNKYQSLYFKIINVAKARLTEGYTEKHHIIPKSMGGGDYEENLVKLTAREHFICHRLLPKFVKSSAHKAKLSHAYWAMCNQTTSDDNERDYKVTSIHYEEGRKAHSYWHSKNQMGEKNHMWGVSPSEETRQKLREAHLGKKHSPETIKRMCVAAKKRGVLQATIEAGLKARRELNAQGIFANTDNTIYKFKNLKENIIFEGTRLKFCNEFGYNHKQLWNLMNNKAKTFDKGTWELC